MKKLILPLVAVVLAVAGSAFTTIKNKPTGDLVWYLVDPNTGEAMNRSQGLHSDTPPTECDYQNTQLCAVALSISEGEVVQSGSTYTIQNGVDETATGVANDQAFKQ